MKNRARLLVAPLVWALLVTVPPSDSPRADEAASEPPLAEPRSPEHVPALETFKNWPPDLLRTRGYWLPWSRMAFQRASVFGRPILFNLTVDWNRAARRLEEEAFADPEVMRSVNAGYISIRVNADLRPDVRARYETGAWPGVFLLLPTGLPMLSQAQTRDLSRTEPIRITMLGSEEIRFLLAEGTVFWGRWPKVLLEVGDAWAEANARTVPRDGIADAQASELMARWLLGNSDRVGGGFGAAPKFVIPWLDEYAAKLAVRGHPDLREQSRLTLTALAGSPLFDEVDGGLHRVAALPGYRAIEYEKMLVGNAAFVRDLTFALRDEDSAELRDALTRTADFIVNVLGREQGGFHLAQVADDRSADGGEYWKAEAASRPTPPPLDPIVLTGPTALAGAALLRAGLLLDRDDFRQAGIAAVEAVRTEASRPGRGVGHSIVPPGGQGSYLVSQADAAFGLLEAYELTGRRSYLELAREVVDFARMNLRRPGEPVFRDHVPEPFPVGLLAQPRWPMRANVRLARSMLRLAHHGQGEDYREDALAILEAFSADLTIFAIAGIELAIAIEEAIAEPVIVKIDGEESDPDTLALRRAAINTSWPWVLVTGGVDAGATGRAGAVASRFGDSKRVTKPAALEAAIENLASASPENE